MVSGKDFNSADLATMRTSSGPMTLMTANGEVQTNKEATSNNWTCSSQLCLFKKLPQCFHWGNSAKNMGIRIIGKAVRIHISSKTTRELIAIYPTMYHLWFLEYRRVLPPLRLHLPHHHLHHTILYLMSTGKSFGETRCINQQKPKTKTKLRSRRKYKEIYRMNCLIGYRNSERIWLMKELQKSLGETSCRTVQTLPVRSSNGAASKSGTGFG